MRGTLWPAEGRSDPVPAQSNPGSANRYPNPEGTVLYMENITSVISFFLSLGGFLYGAVKLFHRKKPLYFKLLVASAGCLVFEQLSAVVNGLTGGDGLFTLGHLGIFASLLFLLSAEYGALDHLADEGIGTKKYRLFAGIAPVIVLAALAAVFYFVYPLGIALAVIVTGILLPAVPASYFSLKHLVLPADALGFLSVTRAIHVCMLLYTVSLPASVIATLQNAVLGNLSAVLTAGLAALISVLAVRGERLWKKQI